MSKIKNKNLSNCSKEKFPIEKKLKKKLNKRQREIQKKLKNRKALKRKESKSEDFNNTCDENHKSETCKEPPLSLELNNKIKTFNSEKFSSNWEQLKQMISNSKKEKGSFQNPKKRKLADNPIKPAPLIRNSEVSNTKINTNNIQSIGTKSIETKSTVTKCPENTALTKSKGPKVNNNVQPNSFKPVNSFSGFQNPKKRKLAEDNPIKPVPLIRNSGAPNTKINTNNNQSIGTKSIETKSTVTKSIENAALTKSEGPKVNINVQPNSLKPVNSFSGPTKAVAIDCEMVGGGLNGEVDILARVSVVNQFGNVLLDKYVKPREEVVDYRTEFSGIRKEDLINAESFESVQKEVSKLLTGRIIVGHGLKNDFHCLYLSHPKLMIRDTSKFQAFRKVVRRGTPSLKRLTENILGIQIQSGEHDSIQDAQAAMRLYCLHRTEWEKEVAIRKKAPRKIKKRKDKN